MPKNRRVGVITKPRSIVASNGALGFLRWCSAEASNVQAGSLKFHSGERNDEVLAFSAFGALAEFCFLDLTPPAHSLCRRGIWRNGPLSYDLQPPPERLAVIPNWSLERMSNVETRPQTLIVVSKVTRETMEGVIAELARIGELERLA